MKLMKVLCLLLAFVIVLPMFASCNKKADQNGTDTSGDEVIEIAGIEKNSYNTTFTIKDQTGYLFQKYYWSETYETSSNIGKANCEREFAIEEHLGIEIQHQSYSNIEEIYGDIMQMHMVGLDGYQLALTHCYGGLVSLMKQGYILDLSEVPAVSLNDEYWNTNIMESVKFQGHMYLGSSSFILHEPNFVLFNKDMADSYAEIGTDTLYEHVRNETWTLEQMQIYANMVTSDLNATLTDPMEGTYGIALHKDWELCSLVTSGGYVHGYTDNDGNFRINGFSEDLFDLFKEIVGIVNSEYCYSWGYLQEAKALSMSSGRALFGLVGTDVMISEMLSTDVPLGVLPIPAKEKGMTMQNLDWAGYFVIPATVQNQQMCGEVAELLSYYGETKIKHEFYDVLLGFRVSQVPEDKEMLDLIFDNLVVDPIIPMIGLGDAVAEIFYSVPWMISKGDNALRSWYEKWYDTACGLVEEVNLSEEVDN